MFRGCGHSFHIECLLPDLSVCKICQATLLSKVEVLGKTANNAVFNNCDSHFNEDSDDETSDDDSESDEEAECYENEEPQQPRLSVPSLLQRINLWQRPQVPQE